MRRCSGAEAGISAELSTFGPLKPLKFHMPRTITLTLSPKQAADRKVYTEIAARRAGVPPADVALVRILKRSVDARGRSVRVNLTLELYADGDGPAPEVRFDYPDVSHAEEVVIVGGGPAGLFCALRLIESGYRPVILERGREVSVRRRDVAELNRNGRLAPTPTMPSAKEVRVPFPTASSLPGARSAEITARRSVRSSSTVPTRRYSMKPIRISVPTGCPVS